MRPEDGSLPGRRMAQEGLARVRQAVRAASLPVKILLVLAVLIIVVLALSLGARFWDVFVVAALVYGPVAIWRGHRSWVASVFVAAWGLVAVVAIAAVVGRFSSGIVPLLLLPCAAAAVSHLPAAVPPLRTLPDGGLDPALGPAAGPAGLVAGARPAGDQLRDRLAAGPGRDRLADGQVAAGSAGAQPPAGPLPARWPHRTGPAARPWRPGRRPASRRGERPPVPARRRVPGGADGGGLGTPRRGRGRPGPGQRRSAATGDHGRGSHGRARQHDRPHLGQGSDPADHRVRRSRAPPGDGGVRGGEAHAALRLPRAARHREDLGGPRRREDLLRLRPARHAGSGGSAAGRPGRRVPRGHRDQDERAGEQRARRGPVHRRGVQPGERQRRAGRPVRPRGDPGAAETGRGRPDRAHHHPGRVREADGGVPGQQPRPELPVRAPGEVPHLLTRRADGPGRALPGAARRDSRRRRAPGAVADDGGRGPPQARR